MTFFVVVAIVAMVVPVVMAIVAVVVMLNLAPFGRLIVNVPTAAFAVVAKALGLVSVVQTSRSHKEGKQ